MDLNSVQGAMQALQTLQSENSLKFEVTRRGQPVALNYVVE
jgi:type II secretory pathway component PulC